MGRSSKRLAGFLAIAVLAATAVAAEPRDQGAAASTPSPSPRERLATAKSFTVISNIEDQVFGTRAEGIMQKATPSFATDWRSNAEFAGLMARILEADGRRVETAPAGENAIPSGEKGSSDDQALSKLSRAISEAHPELDIDVQLFVLMLPLDRYGREYRPGAYFLSWGIVGLLSHQSETFRPAYVVRVNDSLSAGEDGKVECTMGYTLVALDAKSHQVIAKAESQLTHGRLPDTFWIGDYSTLSEEDRNMLHRSCVDGLVGSVTASLHKLGVLQAR